MSRARARIRKDAGPEPIKNSLPSGYAEGGVHVHGLERENERTKLDGLHAHVFLLPDGTAIFTEEDGAHQHTLDGDDWIHHGGDHSHKVEIAGVQLLTEVGGYHQHDTQTDSTAFDGTHCHKLQLPDGTVIDSLTPKDYWRLEGKPDQAGMAPAPPASELAKAEKYSHINFKPPAGVASAASKGLDYREKGGGGGLTPGEAGEQGVGSGVARATSLKNRQNQSPETVRRMKRFFARHEKNKTIDPKYKDEPWKDKGYVAWLLWGGDPGKAWADKIVRQMDAADEKVKKAALMKRAVHEAHAIINAQGNLEVRFGDETILLMVGREETSKDADGIDLLQGSAHNHPITCTVRCGFIGVDERGEIAIDLGKGEVEPGSLVNDQAEWFVRLPAGVVGTLEMTKRDGLWYAVLTRNQAPKVLKTGALPPLGCSGLPQSLEADVPEAMRYWEAEDIEKAAEQLDWLIETEYFSHDAEIRLVGKSYRRVKVERRFYLPTEDPVSRQEAMSGFVNKMAPHAGGVLDVVWGAAAENFDKARPTTNAAIVMLMDSPENREKLRKTGRVFKLRDVAVSEFIFAATFRVPSSLVAWLDEPEETTVAKAEDVRERRETLHKVLESTRFLKAEENEERFVFGVAMEPDEVDSHGHTQSAFEIRRAAHNFMADYQVIGLQHQIFGVGVKILESYIAPQDMEIEGVQVKKGTWLFGVRVLDDKIWAAVKRGDITGFSIGGTAVLEPV